MKLEVKYIFPTSTSGGNNYIYKLLEGLGMRKILVHGTRMDFHRFLWSYVSPKSHLHPQIEI